MTASPKDVIYIDVDDEITAVIEKVLNSSSNVVALVLPKRAATFQSIVNMKILKRSAASSKKSLVLITSESNLLPLAGAVGLHVAKTLQSKPAIPDAPATSEAPVSAGDLEIDNPDDKSAKQTSPPVSPIDDDKPIEIDNDDTPAKSAVAGGAVSGAKKSFNKKLKVPNFDKFRNRLGLGIALVVLLIVGWILAIVILPKAKITIKTDSTDVVASITVTASPSVQQLDKEDKIVPGLLKELKKSDTQKAPATGQKDTGTKATGTVTLSLNDCNQPAVTVPAGTTVSAGNLSFVTQTDANMQSVKFGNQCRNSDFKEVSTAKVKVTAQNAGDQYNLSSRNYSVNGFSNVSGSGTAMSGGTSKIVKVVSQQDIDNLRDKIIETLNQSATAEISDQLKDEGFFPISDTFVSKNPLVVPSPGADSESAEVTVNVSITYTMVGAEKDGLIELLEDDIKSKIDKDKQNILDNGIDNSTIKIESKNPNGLTKFTLETTALAGVEQNESDIKKAVFGKKKKEVESILRERPGVEGVEVDYSPFWVYKVPSKESKINVQFEQQDTNSSNDE